METLMAPRKKRAVPKYKVFGERLQFFREQRGMDQLTLGRESGYRSGSAITQMEQGTYNPTLDKIIKIAAVLRIPTWWLLSNDGTTHDPLVLDLRDVPPAFHTILGELIQTLKEQCH